MRLALRLGLGRLSQSRMAQRFAGEELGSRFEKWVECWKRNLAGSGCLGCRLRGGEVRFKL